MGERRVGDPDLLRDRAQARAAAAPLGEHLDRPVEDLLTAGDALRVPAAGAGGVVVGLRFAIELSSEFDARSTLKGYDVWSVMQF